MLAREAAAADVRINAPVERRPARDKVGGLIISTESLGRAAGVVDDLEASYFLPPVVIAGALVN